MTTSYGDGTANPFERKPTVAEVDAAIYGGEPVDLPRADVPISGRMIAEPIDIMEIWPDMKQPRRAIPTEVRSMWDGNPATIGEVFEKWHSMASERCQAFDMTILLLGGSDGTVYETTGYRVYNSLMELVSLAANIQEHGLLNPITVWRSDDRYVIETGERRWLAHHLLVHYLDRIWHKRIPARVQDKFSVWRQAEENGARTSLNAIGRARQLALLLMDMHDEVCFDRYEALVLPGECDRIFYAQVADGQLFRVKRGMAQKVLDAMGLKSIRQISQYRALLSIPNDLWKIADAQNWTEFGIRSHMESMEQQNIEQILPLPPSPETIYAGTTVPLTDENKPDTNEIGGQEREDRPCPEPPEAVGQGAMELPFLGTLQYYYGRLAECVASTGDEMHVSLSRLSELSPAKIDQLINDPDVDFADYLDELDHDFRAVVQWIWEMHDICMEKIRNLIDID